MDDSDLPLVVPVSALADYCQCSICMCDMKTTTFTTCGHRFCEDCINEWVNRRHKCPCCNAHLTTAKLLKDHQFDSLIETIETEKEKSETEYFERVINAASTSEGGGGRSVDSLTPVEQILKKHLKQGLSAHGKYFQSLKKSYEQKHMLLTTRTDKAIQELASHGLSPAEVSLQTDDLKATLSRQTDDLNAELQLCAKEVADAYDKYLNSHIPSLDILPVKVTITMATKGIHLSDVTLNPTDGIAEIRSEVEARMVAKHNPVHEWGDDVRFFLFGPFAKCSPCEMDQIMRDVLLQGATYNDVQLLAEGCKLGLQYGMKPGSGVVVYGCVRLEADLPKKCFVDVFRQGEGQKVDYFSCTDCGFKWVCRSCMEKCHEGHQTLPYIMQHQPAWACCYCPKKKKCIIQETG